MVALRQLQLELARDRRVTQEWGRVSNRASEWPPFVSERIDSVKRERRASNAIATEISSYVAIVLTSWLAVALVLYRASWMAWHWGALVFVASAILMVAGLRLITESLHRSSNRRRGWALVLLAALVVAIGFGLADQEQAPELGKSRHRRTRTATKYGPGRWRSHGAATRCPPR